MSLCRELLAWMGGGDTGMSSECMALHLSGICSNDDSHPHDPDDLGRCMRLLFRVPALRSRLAKMATVSPAWAALVARWDELERCMADEVGIGWHKGRSAPKTYALMRSILDPIERADRSSIDIGGGVTLRVRP